MLVLPIHVPALLDHVVEPTLTLFEAAFPFDDHADDQPVWMRVKLIEHSPGILAGAEFGPTPEWETDLDQEFDVDLTFDGERLTSERNRHQLRDVFFFHWVGLQLRRRMEAEGRELAHLSDSELENLIARLWPIASAPDRWTVHHDEMTTLWAALYERDAREEESNHDRLMAVRDAAALRERSARERADSLTWFTGLDMMQRYDALDEVAETLKLPDLIVVAYRQALARGDAGPDLSSLPPIKSRWDLMASSGRH